MINSENIIYMSIKKLKCKEFFYKNTKLIRFIIVANFFFNSFFIKRSNLLNVNSII